MLETRSFDAAVYLRGWAGVREFLVATLEEGTPADLPIALHTITRAPGFPAFAEHIGMSEADLKAAFSDPHRQDFARLNEVLQAIGWRLTPSPLVAEAA